MTFDELCKQANVEGKEIVELIYSNKDPIEVKNIIMQKYGIALRGRDMLNIFETMPIGSIGLQSQEV